MENKMRKIIVLMTDFGGDFYVGQMKAVIKNISPTTEIVDLAHNIQPQNVIQAAVILGSSYKYFPKNSIFVCVVDPGVGSERKIIVLETKNYLFIAPNNGLLSQVVKQEKKYKVYYVHNEKYFLKPVSFTFHGRDIFSPVAAYIASGVKIKTICREFDKDEVVVFDIDARPYKKNDKKVYVGKYLFSDSFGNIVTNIRFESLPNIDNVKLKIKKENKVVKILKLKRFYSEVPVNAPFAYLNSFGYLEIAVNKGNAYKWLSCYGDINSLSFVLEI